MCKHCANSAYIRPALSANSIAKADPTRTITLRKAYSADMSRRFKAFWRGVRKWMIEDDGSGYYASREADQLRAIIGMRKVTENVTSSMRSTIIAGTCQAIQDKYARNAYEFPQQADKAKAFRAEVNRLVAADIMGTGATDTSTWMDDYIDSAYSKGMTRGEQELVKAGYDVAVQGSDIVGTPMLGERHLQSIQTLYARQFELLNNITTDMGTRISAILVDGMGAGENPKKIARTMVDRVGISLRRAKTMARTEIIKAHHVALWNQYYDAQVEGVLVEVEFSATGDDRMCEECANMDGRVYPLAETYTLIPVHPNCRCCLIPAKRSFPA